MLTEGLRWYDQMSRDESWSSVSKPVYFFGGPPDYSYFVYSCNCMHKFHYIYKKRQPNQLQKHQNPIKLVNLFKIYLRLERDEKLVE
jgi:hypothetical protein